MGAAENQDRDTDTASLHLVLIPWLTLLSGVSFCDLVEAQLAHRGTLYRHNFYEAELIQCHTLSGRCSGQGHGCCFFQLRTTVLMALRLRGAMVGGKEKEKEVRPGALTSVACLL